MKALCFDTILCVNVLEHIEDDATAIRRMDQILAADGHTLILVPAHQWLYGEYDRLDGHYRRYNKRMFADLVRDTSLTVKRFVLL